MCLREREGLRERETKREELGVWEGKNLFSILVVNW